MGYKFTQLDAGRHQGKTITIREDGGVGKAYAKPATYWKPTIRDVESLEELVEALRAWKTGTILTTGTPWAPVKAGEKIERNKKTLVFQGSGIIGFDADEIAELCRQNGRSEPKTLEEVTDALRSIHPALEKVGIVATTSSSSFVNGGPLKGAHLYALTTDTALNPDVLEALHIHATAKGWGRHYVSGIGVLLKRSLVDTALKTPCQQIFEGLPIMGEGVDIERKVEVFPGEPLTPEAITADEEITSQAEAVWEGWRSDPEIKAEMVAKKGAWIAKRVGEGMDESEASTFAERVAKGGKIHLPLGLTITMNTDEVVTVREILEKKATYNGQSCHDPLDPDDGAGKATIHTNGKTPTINSFAHGGAVYELPGVEALCLLEIDKAPEEDRIEVLEDWGERLAGLPVSRREKFFAHLAQRKITKKVAEAVIKSSPAVAQVVDDKTSETAVAESFATKYVSRLRYDSQEGEWFGWNGHWWEKDETGRVVWRMTQEVKTVAEGDGSMLTNRFTTGALKQARVIPEIVVKSGWNPRRDLLGTEEGTIELKMGTLRDADPADLITQVVPMKPEAGEPKEWLAFLEQIFLGDSEMVDYMQLVLGYAITGEIREEAFFVLAGKGGNGKGTMLEIIQKVIGNGFYRKAESATFTAKKGTAHPTDRELLKGSRIVVCSETEDGKRWDEAMLKDMSAPDGGLINSRGMNKDFSSWTAHHTILFATNFIPHLKNGKDPSMKRRLHIIPFDYTPTKPDRSLKTRLVEEEGPQILAWLVEGARKWYELTEKGESIPKPKRVERACGQYFMNQDRIGEFFASYVDERRADWLEDETQDSQGRVKAETLFAWWKLWAKEAGEEPGTSTEFGTKIPRRFECLKRSRPKVKGMGVRREKVTCYDRIDLACKEAKADRDEAEEAEPDEEEDLGRPEDWGDSF